MGPSSKAGTCTFPSTRNHIRAVAHPSRRPLRGLLMMRSVLLKQDNLMLRSAPLEYLGVNSARVSKHGPQARP